MGLSISFPTEILPVLKSTLERLTQRITDTTTGAPLFVDDRNLRVGIRTKTPATSAALEIAGTTGALLIPRLTTAQRDALTAVNGMIIFNTTTVTFQGYNGTWNNL